MSPARLLPLARALLPSAASAGGAAQATVLTFEGVSQLGPTANPGYGDRATTFATVRVDSGVFTFPASTVLGSLPTPIRSSLPLRLVIEDFGGLGLDTLPFSQTPTLPEPGTWAMWLAGAAVLGARARRRGGAQGPSR